MAKTNHCFFTFRETKFKNGFILHFLAEFTMFVCVCVLWKYILIECFEFLFWREKKKLKANIHNFREKQTKYSRVCSRTLNLNALNIVCLFSAEIVKIYFQFFSCCQNRNSKLYIDLQIIDETFLQNAYKKNVVNSIVKQF